MLRTLENSDRKKGEESLEFYRNAKYRWKHFQSFSSCQECRHLDFFFVLCYSMRRRSKYLKQKLSILGEIQLIHMHVNQPERDRQTVKETDREQSWQWQSLALCVVSWVRGGGRVLTVFTPALNHSPFNITADGRAAINPASASRPLHTVFYRSSTRTLPTLKHNRARGAEVKDDWQLDRRLTQNHSLPVLLQMFPSLLYFIL